MRHRLQLEVFDSPADPSDATVVLNGVDLEETRLASFETGYKAGWDDAIAAQTNDQALLRAEIARNLQALSFTYVEARTHVLRALQPLMTEVVAKLLPDLARRSLPYHLAETFMPLAEEAADAPITLLLNPATRPAVEPLIEAQHGLPLRILDEPTLGEGQAWLRFGDAETRIDLDTAVSSMRGLIDDFFTLTEKETRHG